MHVREHCFASNAKPALRTGLFILLCQMGNRTRKLLVGLLGKNAIGKISTYSISMDGAF